MTQNNPPTLEEQHKLDLEWLEEEEILLLNQIKRKLGNRKNPYKKGGSRRCQTKNSGKNLKE